MTLTKDHLSRIARVAHARQLGFVELVILAELDPATAFRGAVLRGSLRDQDLRGFDFTGAKFQGCDLVGADLTSTKGVTSEMLETALWDETTCLPPGLDIDEFRSKHLFISVLDGIELTYDGKPVRLRNRKALAIFAYLALSESRGVSRERLVNQFWSSFDNRSARAGLRRTLNEMKLAMQAIGCEALLCTRTTLALQAGLFTVDLDQMIVAVAAGKISEALVRQIPLVERLLSGFEELDPSFHDWVIARRQAWYDRLIINLENGYRNVTSDVRQRRRLAEATLLLDPTHEDACRVFMRCAAEGSDIDAAQRAYTSLYKVLEEDHGQAPSEATQALMGEIEAGREENSSRGNELQFPDTIPAKPALFVENFGTKNMGYDQAHLVEGFRSELIACLTRFREWYVTGNQWGRREDVPVDASVSTRYVVTARVHEAGDAINISMSLEEHPSGHVIWPYQFELRLDQWLKTQQHIVRRIAAILNVQLSAERLRRLSPVPDFSLDAYDVWLRSQMVMRDLTADRWQHVERMLEQAIERWPNFSPLYSSLAQINNSVHILLPGVTRDLNRAQRAVEWAQRAVTLDRRDSRAQLCLGWALAFANRYALASIHMGIACDQNMNDPWTLTSAAMFHAFNGDLGRARELSAMSMGVTLSPSPSQWAYLASIHYLLGEYEGTISATDRVRGALSTLPAWRAAALYNLGRRGEAIHEVELFYRSVRTSWYGDRRPTEEEIGRWFLNIYPIGNAATWERLRTTLVAIGMPVAGCYHDG